ncbi:MAG: glycosyltransferase family protein [Planctomycetota bacterium]|jgi:glycosyltransferase involved in cell wall biosynthesis
MNYPRSVVFIHYHLRGGGVTRVIEHTQKALAEVGIKSAVITGEKSSDSIHNIQNTAVIDELAYSSDAGNFEPGKIKDKIYKEAKKLLGTNPDIWHIHNHSLGKNICTPLLVNSFAADSQHLLLQPHDFAEDGRPENYKLLKKHINDDFSSTLYPQGQHIHYAFINNRDLLFMKNSGAFAENLHYLPNAAEISIPHDTPETRLCPGSLFLYPTRGIRRKNIGEMLLWATMAEDDDLFASTLAPKNPAALPVYSKWKNLAAELDLPVLFEAGEKQNFAALMSNADYLFTTSVAEGFGLAFLEAALLKKNLTGRKLPEITDEFEGTGITLSTLYTSLDIPESLINRKKLTAILCRGLEDSYNSYERLLTEDIKNKCINSTICKGFIDFGKLDEELQEETIRKFKNDSSLRNTCPKNMTLKKSISNSEIESNYRTTIDNYSLSIYSKKLLNIYSKILASSIKFEESLDADKFLNEYLSPERFRLLRT